MLAAWAYAVLIDSPLPVAVSGKTVRAIDGDSIAVGDEQIRLDGIDAPEYRQRCSDAKGVVWDCGKAARTALEEILQRPGLTCVSTSRDDYGRLVATCLNGSIADIGAAQVAAGMAVSDEFFGMRSYGEQEDAARRAKKGIWKGTFIRPSQWRTKNITRQRT